MWTSATTTALLAFFGLFTPLPSDALRISIANSTNLVFLEHVLGVNEGMPAWEFSSSYGDTDTGRVTLTDIPQGLTGPDAELFYVKDAESGQIEPGKDIYIFEASGPLNIIILYQDCPQCDATDPSFEFPDYQPEARACASKFSIRDPVTGVVEKFRMRSAHFFWSGDDGYVSGSVIGTEPLSHFAIIAIPASFDCHSLDGNPELCYAYSNQCHIANNGIDCVSAWCPAPGASPTQAPLTPAPSTGGGSSGGSSLSPSPPYNPDVCRICPPLIH